MFVAVSFTNHLKCELEDMQHFQTILNHFTHYILKLHLDRSLAMKIRHLIRALLDSLVMQPRP